MEKIVKAVEYLNEKKIKHKRLKKQLSEFPIKAMWLHFLEEAIELRNSSENDKNPNIDEAGDIIGVFIHICLRNGWTMKQVEAACIKKFIERFKCKKIDRIYLRRLLK